MKYTTMLTTASLISMLLLTLHITDDIVRGMEPGTLSNLTAIPIIVVWLYGTLVLGQRRSGLVIILLGSLLGLGIPFVHMKGAGVGEIARADGFFFVWALLTLGVTSLFSIILAVRLLWNPQWGQTGKVETK